MTYAIAFEGKTFTPDGQANIDDIAAHNASIEAAELAEWATAPDHFACYIVQKTDDGFTRSQAETWLGTPLARVPGSVIYNTYRNRLTGTKMSCVKVYGTNGATYVGRFGSDWSQFCRLRKVKNS